MNKKQNIPLRNIQPDTVPFSDGDGLKYWKSFRHAITTIRLLQNPKTRRLNSPDELVISGYKPQDSLKQRSESSRNFSEALKYIQMQQALFTSIEKGHSSNIIEEILNKDPKKYIHIINEVNKKNQKGLTPLYVAAKLGHLDICRILVEKGANPQTTVSINGIEETPLEVAQRWRHLNIVHFLKQQL
ncbi:unnamed protein product (macronuclear) [Paramecium tetraurelia]|uniref:Uncharacterized protein n=1 Tax=Paramecium tetraurelia TaxID=5888 RepID=A0E704_PARTE|nr:uncharacterized protein GSPATT00023799001 [Paramecium tetraurelia]CAK91071.1 unnamed protein product [Paramecium tetraurelia]|eukprot:XP_001458468.1 hypothetical protein (macronuclear) [Paramecium tetraurelia strain d4-2]